MNLKNLNIKQLLLQRGERIGLYVAAGLMALMLALGLKSVFTSSASANARSLKDLSENKKKSIQTQAPSETEKAELSQPDPKIRGAITFEHLSPDKFSAVMALFAPGGLDDTKRRGPKIKVPVEFLAAVVHPQLRVYRLLPDRKHIAVVTGGAASGEKPGEGSTNSLRNLRNYFDQRGGAADGGAAMPPGMSAAGAMGSRPGMMPAAPRQPGMMMPMEGMGGTGEGSKGTSIKVILVDELDKDPTCKPAEDILPTRMAVVAGSFPYKDQLEEFRQALHYKSVDELIADRAAAPQFLGVEVERATLIPGENVVNYQPLNLEQALKPYLLRGQQRFEDDVPELEPVVFDGLAMPRPLQIHKDQYPIIETQLKHIEATLARLKKVRKGTIVKPTNPFRDDQSINPFQRSSPDKSSEEGGMPAVRPATSGARPGEEGGTGTGQESVIPDYCLTRFLDPTVEPGKSYKYRIRIVVVNPNFQHKDVAWASLAAEDKLRSDWVDVPQIVRVPPELYYYAVDMKATDPKAFWNTPSAGPNQVAAQVHRWLDSIHPDPGDQVNGFFVGDWSVAERVLLTRGEYLGRQVPVEVPVWDPFHDELTLAGYKRSKKVPVFFGITNAASDALLVDFQGGTIDYNRFAGMEDDKPKYVPVRDKVAVELIYMTPDGKLHNRNAAEDIRDEERTKRESTWKARLDEIRKRQKGGKQGTNPANPFGT